MTTTAAPDLLQAIVAAARRAAQVRETVTPLEQLEGHGRHRPNGAAFAEALRTPNAPRIIAECKRRSPSRGILREDYDPPEHARAYAAAGAAAISVLTEPTFFDGSLDHFGAVREAVRLPLLRKDFIVTPYQIHESAFLGADAILLIAGALDSRQLRQSLVVARARHLAALVEVHDETELELAIDAGAEIIGVNSRNLRTLDVDRTVHERLAQQLPDYAIKVAESGIGAANDLRRLADLGYDAFLVGERLISRPDPGVALQELRSW